MTENYDDFPDLGKWPRLVVVGADVTPTQAEEILIRTNSPFIEYINDRLFGQAAARALGYEPVGDQGTGEERRALQKKKGARLEALGTLPLHEIFNNRIGSSWIGGPHGWVDWDGRIGCSTWNIGKWPTIENVLHDWKLIAEAFPYLNLTVQLISDEGEGRPLVEFRIKNGKVSVLKPTEALPVGEIGMDTILSRIKFGQESGISLFDLKRAVDRLAARRG